MVQMIQFLDNNDNENENLHVEVKKNYENQLEILRRPYG